MNGFSKEDSELNACPNSHREPLLGYMVWMTATLLFIGCGRNATEMPNSDEKSERIGFGNPSALLAGLRASLVNKDEELFRRCFKEPESYRDCLDQTYRKVQVTFRLREVISEIYGEGAWDQFQQSGHELGSRPKLTPDVVPTAEEWWNKLEVQQNGSAATFYNPVTQMTNVMVRINDEWKIDTSLAFGANIDCKKLAEHLKRTTDAVEEVTAEVQNQKVRIEEIGSKLFEKSLERRGSR